MNHTKAENVCLSLNLTHTHAHVEEYVPIKCFLSQRQASFVGNKHGLLWRLLVPTPVLKPYLNCFSWFSMKF